MRKLFEIRAAADGEVDVYIYDYIDPWGVDADAFVKELATVEASTINLRINSGGGIVFDGLAIYNALARHPARVVSHIDGLAASAASFVALAGDEVRIAANAFVMVHNAWGFAMGNKHDMMEMAAILSKLDGSLAGMYSRKTGATREEAAAWMDGENAADGTWFDAEEAVAAGLADSIEDPVLEEEGEADDDVEASFDLSGLSGVPDRVAARFGGGAKRRGNAIRVGRVELEYAARVVDDFRSLEGDGDAPAEEVELCVVLDHSAAALELAAISEATLERTRL